MGEKNINMDRENVSIIIPNYNGKELLRKNLPSVIKAIRPDDEIIIVDDGSNDDSVEFIFSAYPRLKLICLEKNRGYAHACNKGVAGSKNEIVYFLNNDIEVTGNFLDVIVPHFNKGDIFAVASRRLSSNSLSERKDFLIGVRFRLGIFWYRYEEVSEFEESIPIIFAPGGCSAFDKNKFLQLGGFDELYRPVYWEDWDISYCAWKQRWKIIYEPRSQVYHRHPAATIKRIFSDEEIKCIRWKNYFLFVWKNITSKGLFYQHLFFLPLQLIIAPFLKKKCFTLGFILALKQLSEVIKKRRDNKNEYNLPDYDVLKQFPWISQTQKGGKL